MKWEQKGQSPDILLSLCPPWGVLSPPLGLAYLAESLSTHGIGVEICDINVLLYRQVDQTDQRLWQTTNDAFWRDSNNTSSLLNKWKTQITLLTDSIADSKSPIIGFSVIDPNEHFTAQILRIVRKKAPSKTIIVGGPGCTDLYQRQELVEESADAIDYFLIGESEQSLPRLISLLKHSKPVNNFPNLINAHSTLAYNREQRIRPNLDTIPFPKFNNFNIALYGGMSLAVMWSRGCISRCLYCKERALLGQYRMRSVESIVDELKYCIETLGINNFVLYDSTVNGNPKRLQRVCDEIIRQQLSITWSAEAIALKSMSSTLLKNMRKAGCHTLVYGIESGSDKILSSMGKLFDSITATKVLQRTHEARIKVAINILVGFPGENDFDFQQTIDFLVKNSRWIDRLDGVSSLQVVCNTPLEKHAADFGIVLPENDPHDKWKIANGNTFEIRQKRLLDVLEVAYREGFEVGRTFLTDVAPQPMKNRTQIHYPASSAHNNPATTVSQQVIPHTVSSSSPPPYESHLKDGQELNSGDDSFKKILIVTCQSLPISGKPTTGGSLRAYNLGQGLEKCGHQVLFSLPTQCLTTDIEKDQWQDLAHTGYNIKDIISKTDAEIVLFCNWGLAAANTPCEIPSIIDMNGSLILENYYRQHSQPFLDSITKLNALANTDYIIAGSETQKAYLTSWCLMSGKNPDSLTICTVPFSLSAQMPDSQDNNEIQFILAGYDWPWLKGTQQIRAVCEELAHSQNSSLHLFTSTAPYSDSINEDSSSDTSGNLYSLNFPALVKHEPVDFYELTKNLSRSSVALDLWQKNPERDLAFPSRTVTYLWSGLPVITNSNGELSKLISDYNAGWIIDSEDISQLRVLTREIINGSIDIAQYRQNAQKLFTDHLCRENTIRNLNNFCCQPFLNRTISPFLAKYYFMRDLSRRLQTLKRVDENQLKYQEKLLYENKKALYDKKKECELMGMVHRRPKGLAVLFSLPLIQKRFHRLIIGTPVLIYLSVLTLIGHTLHILWTRRNRS